MKKTVPLLFMLLPFLGLPQNNLEEIIKPRLTFEAKKQTDSTKTIIDSLYLAKELFSKTDLETFVKAISKDNSMLRRYKSMVFRHNKKIYLKQWSVPIIIYFDEKIPAKVRKALETFLSQINTVQNFRITSTKHISKANYFIKTTTSNINGYADDYEFESEEERLNNPLTGGTYHLINDKNYKLFCGTLIINPDNKDNNALLKQLKQLIFISLGQFYTDSFLEEESLLSNRYNNGNEISQNDLLLLELHYSLIYPQRINKATFESFVNYLKCKYE
ncbi:MAG: hypothetical protein R2802_02590 [Flavobacteriaceae bacterium]|nr:hypothetical protein [Mangrovimonas sp.]MCB0432128.1 hypothetical protein [Mangrovimonas sp.]HRV55647.1 hypothetical protein [Mangrovimonas sp.]